MRTPPLLLIAALCVVGVVGCKDTNNPTPPPVEDAGTNPGGSDAGDGGGTGTDAGQDAGQVVLSDGGVVTVPVCKSTGTACGAAGECCTGTCTNGTCGAVAGQGSACRVTGDSCDAANPCCSTNCQSGRCAPADPTCRTTNDVCFKGADCCSGTCSQNNSGTAGVCLTTSGGAMVGGTPCTDGTNCATRVCADSGTGVKVCQRVSGCQVAGDFCSADAMCCGGVPNGTVDCTNTNNRCDNGQSCRAPGTICGDPVKLDGTDVLRPDGTPFKVNNETNCCGGWKVQGKEQTCRLDEVGVPRCFGGGSAQCPSGYTGEAGCCIAAGQVCDFADQCCNGTPCVPGADGVRRCAAAQTCKAVGTTCDPNASGECCNGTACLPASELTFACRVPPPPTGGTDGGTPDAGTPPPACVPNGTSCSATAPCCSKICNASGVCEAEAACQPQDATCSTTGDCCTGLSCNIPSGSTSGTCKAGATCSAAGQACTTPTDCCSGLSCNGGTCGFIIG